MTWRPIIIRNITQITIDTLYCIPLRTLYIQAHVHGPRLFWTVRELRRYTRKSQHGISADSTRRDAQRAPTPGLQPYSLYSPPPTRREQVLATRRERMLHQVQYKSRNACVATLSWPPTRLFAFAPLLHRPSMLEAVSCTSPSLPGHQTLRRAGWAEAVGALATECAHCVYA